MDSIEQILQKKQEKIGFNTEVKDTFNAGSISTYTDEEKEGFANVINWDQGHDKDLQEMGIVPINAENEDLFSAVKNGVLLCKMINSACPETLDERAINKTKLNVFKEKENLVLAINSAKSIGCQIINITAPLIMEGRKTQILGLLWQLIKIRSLNMINIKDHPDIIVLKRSDEELEDFLKLSSEELLLRWFNYHLANAQHPRRVANLTSDIQDGECYTVLLNQLDGDKCDKSGLDDKDLNERAKKIILNADKLGVPKFMRPNDITTGNQKLNLIFASHLFNACPKLKATEKELKELAGIIDDDVEGSREERSFRMWCNSLGVENVYLNNLYDDIKDGIVLLKILDKIEPGSVNWAKCEKKPNHIIKKVTNCNQVIEVGKGPRFKINLVTTGGKDLHDGNKKLILGYLWQLVKKHTLMMLGDFTEEKLVEWGNKRVPQELQIQTFKDKSISNSKYLFAILKSVDPEIINWELVKEGETDEDKQMNAKYVISIARILGCVVFALWNDIVEVKPKMILCIVGALAKVAIEGKTESTKDFETNTKNG